MAVRNAWANPWNTADQSREDVRALILLPARFLLLAGQNLLVARMLAHGHGYLVGHVAK
jgi:hypothetical protein